MTEPEDEDDKFVSMSVVHPKVSNDILQGNIGRRKD